jgi:hypothetical protein
MNDGMSPVQRDKAAGGFDERVKGLGEGEIEIVEMAATFGRELAIVGQEFPGS